MNRAAILLPLMLFVACTPVPPRGNAVMDTVPRSGAEQTTARCWSLLMSQLNETAALLERQGVYDEAESAYNQLLDLYHNSSAREPKPDCRANEAATLEQLGKLYMRSHFSDRPKAALDVFERRLALSGELAGEEPTRHMLKLADALEDVSEAARLARDDRRAVEARVESVRIFKDLAVEKPDGYEFRLADRLRRLAYFYRDYGRYEDGIAALQEGLEIDRRLATLDKGNLMFVGLDLSLMGRLSRHTGQYEFAEACLREAIEVHEGATENDPGSDPLAYANDIAALGDVYCDTDRLEQCEQQYQKAHDLYRHLAETDPAVRSPALAASFTRLGAVYQKTGNTALAEASYNAALGIYREIGNGAALTLYARNLALTLSNLGSLVSAADRLADAERLLNDALIVYRTIATSESSEVRHEIIATSQTLANVYDRTGRSSEAERLRSETEKAERLLNRPGS